MTLSDVHADPRLLADLLGVPFEDYTGPAPGYYARYGYAPTVTIPAAERVATAWGQYRTTLESDWARSPANPYRPQTWGQFLAECLREGLGIRSKGKLADRLDYARMSRPDLYQSGVAARCA